MLQTDLYVAPPSRDRPSDNCIFGRKYSSLANPYLIDLIRIYINRCKGEIFEKIIQNKRLSKLIVTSLTFPLKKFNEYKNIEF